MNRAVRLGATPVLLALVATGLAAAPAGAAPTWVAPAVTLAEGTSARPPADSHVVVDAAGNATVAWVDQDGPRRRRPRAGLDPPARRPVVGTPGHLRRGRHLRRDRHRHERRRLHRRGVDPEHGRHRRARGRDPGSGRSLVGAGPRGRQHRRCRDSPGGRGCGWQRGRHVAGEGRAALPAVRHQARGRSLVGSRGRVGPSRGHRQQRATSSSSPRRPGDRRVDSIYLPMPTTAGHPVRRPCRRVAPSASPRPSRRPPRTPGSPRSR